MIIEVDHLSKTYGVTTALKDVNLGIQAGQVVGLLGPNGAGKTTLVETLEGLRCPTSGKVSVLGFDPFRQARSLRDRIGVQLQSTAIPAELTPVETLKLFSAFFSRSIDPWQVLQRVGLEKKIRLRNRTLSSGQQRRLAIAMALINDPELIILDEPTSGLDPIARREIHAYIADLKILKRTVFLSTHSIEEAEKLCDRVILLRSGEVVADGSPLELTSRAAGATSLFIVIEGDFDPEPLLRAGASVEESDGPRTTFVAANPKAAVVALGELLQKSRATVVEIRMKRPSLEDFYLSLMGETASEPEGDT